MLHPVRVLRERRVLFFSSAPKLFRKKTYHHYHFGPPSPIVLLLNVSPIIAVQSRHHHRRAEPPSPLRSVCSFTPVFGFCLVWFLLLILAFFFLFPASTTVDLMLITWYLEEFWRFFSGCLFLWSVFSVMLIAMLLGFDIFLLAWWGGGCCGFSAWMLGFDISRWLLLFACCVAWLLAMLSLFCFDVAVDLYVTMLCGSPLQEWFCALTTYNLLPLNNRHT